MTIEQMAKIRIGRALIDFMLPREAASPRSRDAPGIMSGHGTVAVPHIFRDLSRPLPPLADGGARGHGPADLGRAGEPAVAPGVRAEAQLLRSGSRHRAGRRRA